MAVKNLGHIFCMDIPDLTLYNGGEKIVVFEICDSDWNVVNSFSETYYVESHLPPNDFCKLRNIGQLIKPYLNPIPLEGDWTLLSDGADILYDLSVNVRIKHYDEGSIGGDPYEIYEFTAYYADVKTNRERANFSPNIGFLSRYDWKERQININQKVLVSFFHRSVNTKFYLGVAYMQNGVARYKEVDLKLPTEGRYFMTTLYAFDAETVLHDLQYAFAECSSVTVDDLIYFTVNLNTTDPGTEYEYLTGCIKYMLDRRYFPQEKHILFYNSFGVWETLVLRGRDERTTQMEATHVWIDDKYRKNTTELVTSHAHNTGFLSDVDHDVVLDLVNSPHVYLYDGEDVGDEITITEFEDTTTFPREEPMNAKITYRLADKQRRFDFRYRHDDVPVFDKTFDESFE